MIAGSSSPNLQKLHDISRQQNIEFEMMVNNIGTLTQPVLDVLSARQIPEMFDMGNLRFGREPGAHAVLTEAGLIAEEGEEVRVDGNHLEPSRRPVPPRVDHSALQAG